MPTPVVDFFQSAYQDPNIPGELGKVVLAEQVGDKGRVTLDYNEIVDLYTTRRVLVPAAGPGSVIVPSWIIIQRKGNTSANLPPINMLLGAYHASATGGRFSSGSFVEAARRLLTTNLRGISSRPFGNEAYIRRYSLGSSFSTILNLYENTPIVFAPWTEATEQQWRDTLAPMDSGVSLSFINVDSGREIGWGYATIDSAGALQTVRIGYAGRGQVNPPNVIVGGGGSGAMVTATITGGKVSGLAIDQAGSGYVFTPTTLTLDISYRIWTP